MACHRDRQPCRGIVTNTLIIETRPAPYGRGDVSAFELVQSIAYSVVSYRMYAHVYKYKYQHIYIMYI